MKISKELFNKLKELGSAYLDENGREMLNPIPVNLGVNMERPLTLQEQIQRVLKSNLSLQAQEQGMETFEESNDFEIDDEDPDPIQSPYELQEEYLDQQVLSYPPEPEKVEPDVPDADPEPDPDPPPFFLAVKKGLDSPFGAMLKSGVAPRSGKRSAVCTQKSFMLIANL